MKALVANRWIATRLLNLGLSKSFGRGCEIREVPKPSINDKEILVKVRAVALNPTDFKHIDIVSPPGSIIGCDYAGEVVEIGKQALGGWKIGDRVAGAVHGGLYPDRGSFAEYLKIDGDLAWKVPENVKDEEAATYGVSAGTAALGLSLHLGVDWASEPSSTTGGSNHGRYILIYAASTNAGLFAVQFAKRSGYTVIATASPHSFDLVKSYGADHVFDYRSPTLVQDITKAFPDIKLAFDCFSEGPSTALCAEIVQKQRGKVLTLLPRGESKTPGVEYDTLLLYTVFGKEFAWFQPIGPKFPPKPSDREAFARYCNDLPRLTSEIKPPPLSVTEGGLDAIFDGLDQLRQGKVSGKKLVVKF